MQLGTPTVHCQKRAAAAGVVAAAPVVAAPAAAGGGWRSRFFGCGASCRRQLPYASCKVPAALLPPPGGSCPLGQLQLPPCSVVNVHFHSQVRRCGRLCGTDSWPKWQCHCGSAPCNLHQTGFFYHASQVTFRRVLSPQGTAERPPGWQPRFAGPPRPCRWARSMGVMERMWP